MTFAPRLSGARPRVAGSTLAVALGVVALGVSLGGYAMLTARHPHYFWDPIDLSVYCSGARAAWHQEAVYALRFVYGLPFSYPPFAAIAFWPVAVLPFGVVKVGMALASIAAVGASIWLVLRAAGGTSTKETGTSARAPTSTVALTLIATAAALWLEPVQQTLRFGQINALLMVLVLSDCLGPVNRRWRGAGIGVATAVKLIPGIFIVYLALSRRFRAAAVAALSFAVVTAVAWRIRPELSRQYWLHGLFLNSSRDGAISFVSNQSLQGLITRFTSGHDHLWWLAAVAAACLGLWAAVTLERERNRVLGTLVCALTGLVVSPVSWSHHWVYVAPALAYALYVALRSSGRRRAIAACSWVAGYVLVFGAWPSREGGQGPFVPNGLIWMVPDRNNREYLWRGFQLVLGNAEIWAGLLLLAIACAYAAAQAGHVHPRVRYMHQLRHP